MQNELFVRFPIAGSVFNCFKNSNRGLPDEFKQRRKRKAPTPDTADLPAPLQQPTSYDEKGIVSS